MTTETTAAIDIAEPGTIQAMLAAAQTVVRAQDEREHREACERAARQAAEAASSAAAYVRERFGEITAQLHDKAAWTGYVPLTGVDSPAIGDLPATAVAWLGPGSDGAGVWLHFEDRTRFYTSFGHLAVVVACPCGRFCETDVDSVRALADALAAALAPVRTCTEKCTPYQRDKDADRADD